MLGKKMIGKYCIVRTKNAGVFAGDVADIDGTEGEIHNSRRLWYWSGAASLSQMAVDGVSNPDNCKFPCAVESQVVYDIIEIIPCADKAIKSIKDVPIWSA